MEVNKEIKRKIWRDIEKEFREDFALQQVHIARKLLSEDAKKRGIEFWKYIKMQAQKIKNMHKV